MLDSICIWHFLHIWFLEWIILCLVGEVAVVNICFSMENNENHQYNVLFLVVLSVLCNSCLMNLFAALVFICMYILYKELHLCIYVGFYDFFSEHGYRLVHCTTTGGQCCQVWLDISNDFINLNMVGFQRLMSWILLVLAALMYVLVPMPCLFFGGGSTQFLISRDGGGWVFSLFSSF